VVDAAVEAAADEALVAARLRQVETMRLPPRPLTGLPLPAAMRQQVEVAAVAVADVVVVAVRPEGEALGPTLQRRPRLRPILCRR
jgi:hypothetical protein